MIPRNRTIPRLLALVLALAAALVLGYKGFVETRRNAAQATTAAPAASTSTAPNGPSGK